VLIDKNLPDIDGLELARRIRTNRSLAGIRIVMLSSSEDLSEVDDVERECWLMKPVRRIELYECLLTPTSAHAPAVRTEPPASRTPVPFAGVRVLLVEDNDINLEVSRAILLREGCNVSIATDGLSGLAAYEQGEFDVIFMDCHMPEMDGFRATASIRAIEAGTRRHTPIVAVTANAIEGDREHCLRAGMDDYLSKPVSRDAMRLMLERWCRKNSTDAPANDASSGPGDRGLCEKALGMLRELESDEDHGILRRVVASFLDNSPGLLENLRRGKDGRDAETLRTASHTLKSTAVVVGAVSLSMYCGKLEALARDGRVDEAIALVDGVFAEYRHVRPLVEAQLRSTTDRSAVGWESPTKA
jgi:two-component system sensor histidine kinase/response regulator